MCGRFTLRTPLTVLVDQFHFDLGNAQLALRYNIAPTQEVAAVRLMDGKRQLATLRWGLIPSWAKDVKIGASAINARADTVATKPMFRTAYKRRRCLVLADGYYEWLRVGKFKQPYLYEVDGGKPLRSLAFGNSGGGPATKKLRPWKPARSSRVMRTSWRRKSTTGCR